MTTSKQKPVSGEERLALSIAGFVLAMLVIGMISTIVLIQLD